MRIELIYAPGCSTYKRTLNVLETVIAEERLPIPVECQENEGHQSIPLIKIDGITFSAPSHEFEGDPCAFSTTSRLVGAGLPCMEQLRRLLSNRWRELTEMPAT